ncbi:UNVERIFIED_CONTAM: hypothetical protein GTU68_048973 [Idotea baltica]|nr:hypothetical protein [Idotea baltica]
MRVASVLALPGPWAAPGMPFKALKWMFQSSAPLKIRPKLDPAQWAWLLQFVLNCRTDTFAQNKQVMQRIAHYSLACLQSLRAETGIEYANQSAGVLQLFQTDEEFEYGALCADLLDAEGIPNRLVDFTQASQIEPALKNSRARPRGGLHLPKDETGDCHLFCMELTALLQAKGVIFHYNTGIQRLVAEDGQIDCVDTSEGLFDADAYVVALGAKVAGLLRPLGLSLPVYPVKGYSITGTIQGMANAPLSSVMDEHSKIMFTRLGDRLRVAGVAEIAGFDDTLRPSAFENVLHRTEALFPGAIKPAECKRWAGFRPMTPDGPPRLGQTRYSNLFLNAGHGSNGWTQACGTSKVVADIVSGRKPDIDTTGLWKI